MPTEDDSTPPSTWRAKVLARTNDNKLFGAVGESHPCWKLAHECVAGRTPEKKVEALRGLVEATAVALEPPKVVATGTVASGRTTLYAPSLDKMMVLPLKQMDLKEIIENKADRAPLGRGADTVVDLTTRKTWRVGLATNDAVVLHDEILKPIIEEVQRLMRPRGEVVAVPYQLLIYEQGDFFRNHKDTLRGPRHFGSLIIELPVESGATGGDLIIGNDEAGERVAAPRCNDDNAESGNTAAVAWSAFVTDLDHKVTPVTSGMRCTLTYQLYDVGPEALPDCPKGGEDLLGATLAYLGTLDRNLENAVEVPPKEGYTYGSVRPVVFGYALEHEYSDKTLPIVDTTKIKVPSRNPARLHGADLTLYTVLRAALDRVKSDDAAALVPRLSVEIGDFRDDSVGRQNEVEDGVLIETEHDWRYFLDFGNRITRWLNEDHFRELRRQRTPKNEKIDTGNEGAENGFFYKSAIIRIGNNLEVD